MDKFDTIFAATDLSEPSLCATRVAGELGRQLGSRLVLTYIVEDRLPPLIPAQSRKSADKLLEEHRRHAERALDEWVARHFEGQPWEKVIGHGVPHEQIVRLAQEHEASLIVIGMHGHGYLAHALSGSTAERVLHRAGRPVLVVPHT